MGKDKVDLSISNEAMLAIREDLRQRLVRKVHFLRLSARLYRKVGDQRTAQRHEAVARKLVAMIKSIEPLEDAATWVPPGNGEEG
ncbi:MAG TPA: hypothetical protein VKX16_08995 [Chloroflexota bacterium]|nr:hypothetical protein [Chloroflexota bacterium]